jgi:hypothetical protein
MGKTHPPYPQKFREEAVRLVRGSGKSIGRVAKDLGISDQSLRNWVKHADLDRPYRPSSLGVWQPTLRRILVPLLVLVAGAAVGVVIHRAGITERLSFRHAIEQLRDKLPSPSSSRSAILPNHRSVAWKMLNEGNLREAQDGFLEILQFDPNEQDALRGLVTVRQRMAQNDPVALRRQARVYQDAVRRGVETEEHYTASSLQALAAASQQAADEIESQNKPSTGVSQDAVP